MRQKVACVFLTAVCMMAAVWGERVPCTLICRRGLINWDGRLGKTACCTPGYKMLVVNGACMCVSPASAPVTAFADHGGSVLMAEPFSSQAQYKQNLQKVRDDLKQMANWMRFTAGGVNPGPGFFDGNPGPAVVNDNPGPGIVNENPGPGIVNDNPGHGIVHGFPGIGL